jgi:hypothetical protein
MLLVIYLKISGFKGAAVAQSAKTLRYNPEDRGFFSRSCQLIFWQYFRLSKRKVNEVFNIIFRVID